MRILKSGTGTQFGREAVTEIYVKEEAIGEEVERICIYADKSPGN